MCEKMVENMGEFAMWSISVQLAQKISKLLFGGNCSNRLIQCEYER